MRLDRVLKAYDLDIEVLYSELGKIGECLEQEEKQTYYTGYLQGLFEGKYLTEKKEFIK